MNINHKTLLVIDEIKFDMGLLSPINTLIQKAICLRIAHKYADRQNVTILASIHVCHRLRKIGFNTVSWIDLKSASMEHNLSDLCPFIDHNEEVIRILEKYLPQTYFGSLTIPRALGYPFVSPHIEHLSPLIHGLNNFFDSEAFSEVLILGSSIKNSAILIDASQQRKIRLNVNRDVLISFFETLVKIKLRLDLFVGFWKLWLKLFFANRSSINFKPKKPFVLFSLHKARSLFFFQDLANSLQSSNIVKPFFLGSLVDPSNTNSVSNNIQNISQYLSGKELLDFTKNYKHLKAAWNKAEYEISKLPFHFLGVNISSHHGRFIKETLLLRGSLVPLYARGMERFFRDSKPELVIASDNAEFSQSIFHCARANKVNSMLHIFADNSLPAGMSLWKRYLTADYIALLNETQLNAYTKNINDRARPVENYFIAGNPTVKVLSSEQKSQVKTRLLKTHNIEANKGIILLLSRHVSEILPIGKRNSLYKAAVNIAKNTNMQLLIRRHPHESEQSILEQLQSLNCTDAVIADNAFTIIELSSVVNLVISLPESSASFYALGAGVPVIRLGTAAQYKKVNKITSEISLGKFNASIETTTAEECIQKGIELLKSKSAIMEQVENGYKFVKLINGPLGQESCNIIQKFIKEKIFQK